MTRLCVLDRHLGDICFNTSVQFPRFTVWRMWARALARVPDRHFRKPCQPHTSTCCNASVDAVCERQQASSKHVLPQRLDYFARVGEAQTVVVLGNVNQKSACAAFQRRCCLSFEVRRPCKRKLCSEGTCRDISARCLAFSSFVKLSNFSAEGSYILLTTWSQ